MGRLFASPWRPQSDARLPHRCPRCGRSDPGRPDTRNGRHGYSQRVGGIAWTESPRNDPRYERVTRRLPPLAPGVALISGGGSSGVPRPAMVPTSPRSEIFTIHAHILAPLGAASLYSEVRCCTPRSPRGGLRATDATWRGPSGLGACSVAALGTHLPRVRGDQAGSRGAARVTRTAHH